MKIAGLKSKQEADMENGKGSSKRREISRVLVFFWFVWIVYIFAISYHYNYDKVRHCIYIVNISTNGRSHRVIIASVDYNTQ